MSTPRGNATINMQKITKKMRLIHQKEVYWAD